MTDEAQTDTTQANQANQRSQQIVEALTRVDHVNPSAADTVCSKHLKMAANPFRFLRGAAQLFYADWQSGLIDLPAALTEQIPLTHVVGDCHISNFGFFTEDGSYGEHVIFAANDFDDACVGHAAWDWLRCLTSLVLTHDFCQGLASNNYVCDESIVDPQYQLSNADLRDTLNTFLQSYLDTCQQIVNDPEYRHHALTGFKKSHSLFPAYKKAKRRSAQGKQFLTKSSLAKAVDFLPQGPRFKKLPGRFQAITDTAEFEQIRDAFAPYVDDSIVDIVVRLGAGTGSVNMLRYYLLVGPALPTARASAAKDPENTENLSLYHVVEAKQQREAAPLFYFPDLSATNRLNAAHLTLNCQRQIQRRPDLILDEVIWRDAHWLVRSRHHARVGIDPTDIGFTANPTKSFKEYAIASGAALALAHSRGDRRSTLFEQQVLATLPECSASLIQAAFDYAKQTEQDWTLLTDMLNSK